MQIIRKRKAPLFLEVASNPNIEHSFDMLYSDVGPARELYCIKYNTGEKEEPVQITGWNAETNSHCPAYACLIEESGDGIALLVYGGSGGVRMKLLEDESPWDTQSNQQWGDTHLVYPANSFTVYKDEL